MPSSQSQDHITLIWPTPVEMDWASVSKHLYEPSTSQHISLLSSCQQLQGGHVSSCSISLFQLCWRDIISWILISYSQEDYSIHSILERLCAFSYINLLHHSTVPDYGGTQFSSSYIMLSPLAHNWMVYYDSQSAAESSLESYSPLVIAFLPPYPPLTPEYSKPW